MATKPRAQRTARTIRLWLVPLAAVALLVFLLVPRRRGPLPTAALADWPTEGWQSACPENQGIDSVKLAEGLLVMRTQQIDIHFPDIEPLLLPALVDMEAPLPPNPAGVSRLRAAVAAVAQPPAPQPVAPLPDTAIAISGQTFVFEPNPAEVEALTLEFDGSDEAILHVKPFGSQQVLGSTIGLDGVYRLSAGDHDLPQGYRGHWADGRTFVLEHDEVANNDHATYRLRFEGERVLLSGQETAHEVGMGFEGRRQNR